MMLPSTHHEIGSTMSYACQFDQRFSYYAYVPKNYYKEGSKTYSLTVVIHGNERAAQRFRSEFKEFAEKHDSIILAPLFPAGIIDKNDTDNYKFIKFHDIRFDLILLAMIDELAEKYRIDKDKFFLHGFSAGGQFAHRFFYLHPNRLLGLSIGAPGRITFLDDSVAWVNGTKDFKEQFGCEISMGCLKKVPVILVIGAEDNGLPLFNKKYDNPADIKGDTRIQRLKKLYDNYQKNGIPVEYKEVAGVGHHGLKTLPPVKEFFSTILKNKDK